MTSVSIEALAMAGVNYMKWGEDNENWESENELPSAHLLVHDDEEEELKWSTRNCFLISYSSSPSYKISENDGDHIAIDEVAAVQHTKMVQWRSMIEKIWLLSRSLIEKMVKAVRMFSMNAWLERRMKTKSL
ncbi:hypothetical protein REPUB_Repub09cG0131400 [Reevesia pubescens]